MNQTIIIGRLGGDATIKNVNSDWLVIGFNVAVSETRKNRDGTKVQNTTWFNCGIWRKTTDSTEIAKYLKKGTQIFIQGKISVNVYQSGNEYKASLNLRVDYFELCGSAPAQNQNPQTNNAAPSSPDAPVPQNNFSPQSSNDSQDDSFTDDLPF
jgi:single-strand DNA-binding protein